MKLESQMKEQLYHRCQIDGGSYCNSFIDIIMVQVNYNLYVMQWLDVYWSSMDDCHAVIYHDIPPWTSDTHPPLTAPRRNVMLN